MPVVYTPRIVTGTYTTSGTSPSDYCVSGNTLTLWSNRSSGNANPVVLTKQRACSPTLRARIPLDLVARLFKTRAMAMRWGRRTGCWACRGLLVLLAGCGRSALLPGMGGLDGAPDARSPRDEAAGAGKDSTTARACRWTGFAPQATYAGSGLSMAVVDVDGDGHLDLVLAIWRMPISSGDVGASVYLNRGDGTFATAVTYAADIQAQSVAAGDFNGDGRPDFAVLNGIDDLDVFINQGAGRFAPFVHRVAPQTAVVMATADLDGDGRPDLAVTTQMDTIEILLGQGDGSFAEPVAYPAGAIVDSIAVSDLNRDGYPDIAVTSTAFPRGLGLPTSFAEGTVDTYLNRGDGTFGPRASYPAGKGTVAITVADFNGDGAPDMAAGNTTDDTISVFFNEGDGTFGQQVTYADLGGATFSEVLGSANGGLAAADFDGDGHVDLAVAEARDTSQHGAIKLLTNAGDGTLLSPSTYVLSSSPIACAAADLNDDGVPDLAVTMTDNTTGVFLSMCE